MRNGEPHALRWRNVPAGGEGAGQASRALAAVLVLDTVFGNRVIADASS